MTANEMLANESNISPTPYPLLEKGNRDSPPFCLRPRAVSDPEGKGRRGGILEKDLNFVKFGVIRVIRLRTLGYTESRKGETGKAEKD